MTATTSPEPQHQDPTTTEPHTEGLVLGLSRRRHAVELGLAGDLDLINVPRFLAAMGWLRRRTRQVIVVDTRGLDFVDLAGYRAFEASLQDRSGARDPRILYVVGDALARVQLGLRAVTGIGPPRLS